MAHIRQESREDHDLCAVASPRQRDDHIQWPGDVGGWEQRRVWGGWEAKEVSKPPDGQLGTCFISR